ncbi:MAG: flagellar biosynthetic protein FliO [Desulfovibrio sp.]|nr:flagellar biosynthetic protein FliO [Desulfovibrio sp.]
MFLLLGLLWFFVRLLRRYGRFNFIPRQGSLPKDAFFMEAQMPVGPRKCLMVVRFMQKRFLLAVTEQQISVVTEERLPKGDFEAYVDEAQDQGR